MKLLDGIKANKGYYTLAFWDTSYGAVMGAVTMSLINRPLGLVMAGIGVVSNIVCATLGRPNTQPAAQVKRAPMTFRDILSLPKKWIKYWASTTFDPHFVVGANASGAGMSLVFQSALAIGALMTTHSLFFLHGLTGAALAGGVAAAVGTAAFGLFCGFTGNLEKWKGKGRYFKSIFNRASGNAPQEQAEPAPRRMRKLLDNKLFRRVSKASQVALSTEASIFSIIAPAAIFVRTVGAMAAGTTAIAAGLLTLGVTMWWAKGSVWNMVSVTRLGTRAMRAQRKKRAALPQKNDLQKEFAASKKKKGGLRAKALNHLHRAPR